MRVREEYEKLEVEILAPYAMKSKDSIGRSHDNSPHPYRTCYQRDRDRIVHSQAFRKLEYKTQVFVILEGDYYRTRLTHTIEVAQIARTIGRSLRLNEDLIEAIALAHDLGHPPFGHAGEEALNACMKQVGEKFNHNLRSFEIVNSLEKRYPDFNGLDLSNEVLVGILKHNTDYDIPGDEKGFESGPTLEARVVDIADALAYLSHDIDDGLTSGLIMKDDLKESKLWSDSYSKIESFVDPENKEMMKYQIVKYLIDSQTRDLLEFSHQRLREMKFRSSREAQEYHNDHPKKAVIDFSPKMKKERGELQGLLLEKLYKHFRVMRMTEKAKRIINEIFEVYKETPGQLPYNVWPRDAKYTKKEKYKIVCDYIAGMTDRSALDEHNKLFDPYKKV